MTIPYTSWSETVSVPHVAPKFLLMILYKQLAMTTITGAAMLTYPLFARRSKLTQQNRAQTLLLVLQQPLLRVPTYTITKVLTIPYQDLRHFRTPPMLIPFLFTLNLYTPLPSMPPEVAKYIRNPSPLLIEATARLTMEMNLLSQLFFYPGQRTHKTYSTKRLCTGQSTN